MSAGAFVGFANLTKLWRVESDFQRYGCYVSRSVPEHECEQWYFPHGDGHLIRISPLPDAVRTRFERFDASLASLPIPASSEQFPWEALTWHRSPLQTQHEKMFRSAFPGSCEEHGAVNRRYLTEIEQILSQPGVYYSCLYRKIDSTIIDAEFLVVDLPHNRLILLSSDT